jgi:hypothetical protein
MEAKIEQISELSKLLSEKSKVGDDLLSLMGRFGLNRLLSHDSSFKKDGVSVTVLVQSLCLFCVLGESIHSIYSQKFYGLLSRGKNCFYRLLTRGSVNWRSLQMKMVVRFLAIIRKEQAQETNVPSCYILDDTTLEKSGKYMEGVSRVFDHTVNSCVLGYKLMILAFFDGKSTLPCDFSLHREKGKRGNYGLTEQVRKKQYHKRRTKGEPNKERFAECDMSKLDSAIAMMRRAWKQGIRASYALADSWFTCERIVAEVRGLGIHYVGLAKMGSTKYLVSGKKKHPRELIARYERSAKSCRKYKCKYITINAMLGDQPVRLFLVRYGKNQTWNILVTSDLSMSFIKAFETYQIRWNIEVLIREQKQYLGLGSYQGRDFDGQVADTTLRFITYIVLSLDKRFSEYETMGALFADKREDLLALTLWKRILSVIEGLLEVLSHLLPVTPEQMLAACIADESTAKQYRIMLQALQKYAGEERITV